MQSFERVGHNVIKSLNADGVLENKRYAIAGMPSRRLSMCSTSLAPLAALLGKSVTRVVGQNVANLHFCPSPKKKICISVPEKRLTVPFCNQRWCFLSRDRKGGTECRIFYSW